MNTTAKMLPSGHPWKIDESLALYQVEAWGKGYFAINEHGHVVIRPSMDAAKEIDLYDVVQGLKARDLHTPVVVRFSDILAHRLRHIAEAFGAAIAENDYRNRYAAVFPIKVNQQRLVVEEVYRYGKEFGFGLEVGSKPELLAVMSITEDAPDRIIVCNGFKDASYIEAVIIATKARPHDHPGRRELRRNTLDTEIRRTLRGSAEDRSTRQARQRGRRAVARIGRRKIQVRACSSARSWISTRC